MKTCTTQKRSTVSGTNHPNFTGSASQTQISQLPSQTQSIQQLSEMESIQPLSLVQSILPLSDMQTTQPLSQAQRRQPLSQTQSSQSLLQIQSSPPSSQRNISQPVQPQIGQPLRMPQPQIQPFCQVPTQPLLQPSTATSQADQSTQVVNYAAVYPYPTQTHPLVGNWHSGCSPHKYELVELPQNVKKCYGCGFDLPKTTGNLHITLSSGIAIEGSCGEMSTLGSSSTVLTIVIRIIS